MRRISMAVAAGASALALLGSAAPAGAAAARAYECQQGFSCYFDYSNGTGWLFNAGRCGEHDLVGGIYQNRISAIVNHGNGAVDTYRWTAAGWRYINTVPVGYTSRYTGGYENEIDRIVIAC